MKCTQFIFLFVLLFISCNEKSGYDASKYIYLDKSILSSAKSLAITTDIWYPKDSIYAKNFFVYADTILIMENKRLAGNFLSIFNIPKQKLLSHQIFYGEGPEEWLFTQIINEGDNIRITDCINHKLGIFNIDAYLKDESYKCQVVSYPGKLIVTSSPVLYNDSVITANPFHYINTKAQIEQTPGRFVVSPINGSAEFDMNHKYMTPNVGQGLIGSSSHYNTLFFASGEKPDIEFYHSNLLLDKIVTIPDVLPEAELSIGPKNNGMRDVCYKKWWPETYITYTALKDKIFFVFTGVKRYPDDDDADKKSYIISFDWDGNVLDCYSIPQKIYALSVSASYPNTFYATIKDIERNPLLVKLELKEY